MFRFVVFAALISLSVATYVDQCLGGQLPENVRIEGCDAPPCKIIRGEGAHMQVDFTLKKPVKALDTKVYVTSRGTIFNYLLPEDNRNVCKNLVGGASCPLTANESVTYDLSIPINDRLPTGYSSLRVYSEDENYNLVTCFAFQVQIVDY